MTLSTLTLQHNVTRHTDIQHKDTQRNTYCPIVMSAVMLRVLMLSDIMSRVLGVVMQNAILISVVMLNVVAPRFELKFSIACSFGFTA